MGHDARWERTVAERRSCEAGRSEPPRGQGVQRLGDCMPAVLSRYLDLAVEAEPALVEANAGAM